MRFFYNLFTAVALFAFQDEDCLFYAKHHYRSFATYQPTQENIVSLDGFLADLAPQLYRQTHSIIAAFHGLSPIQHSDILDCVGIR